MAIHFPRAHARQAIATRYVGPSNVRGSRIIATTESGHRIIVSYDHALNPQENHREAAKALAEKLGWDGTWEMGGVKGGYVFVNTSR